MKNELTSLTETFSPQITGKFMSKIKLAAQREGSEVIIANMHEQGRALLTKTALDNLGALSALEAHLTVMAPYGQERYKQIVDAYTLGAAQKIWRW
jgi:predicted mannosyl-3-phosphoglycerate phosphatase (HAD superfamily)